MILPGRKSMSILVAVRTRYFPPGISRLTNTNEKNAGVHLPISVYLSAPTHPALVIIIRYRRRRAGRTRSFGNNTVCNAVCTVLVL